jgi:hypothetical protein
VVKLDYYRSALEPWLAKRAAALGSASCAENRACSLLLVFLRGNRRRLSGLARGAADLARRIGR